MGQKLGKTVFVEASLPLLNLERDAILDLWEGFEDVAEGFGINVEEFKEICSVLQPYLGHIKKPKLMKVCEEAFRMLDTDTNDLIDSLEFHASVTVTSGCSISDKLSLIFNYFDFDETGEISVDEMVLLLMATMSGLAKFSGIAPPDERKLEVLVQKAFQKAKRGHENIIQKQEFIDYCLETPEIVAWMHFYDSSGDMTMQEKEYPDSDIDLEMDTPIRDEITTAYRNQDEFKEVAYKWEDDREETKKKSGAALSKFTEVKKWHGILEHVTPTYPPPKDDTLPEDNSLKLEWIHGYSSQHSRNNLSYISTGDFVYPAAGVAVVMNAERHEQRYAFHNSDEILSLAMHPNGTFCATGELGVNPKIQVWNVNTMKLISTLKGFHKNAVTHLAFSKDGKSLVSIGKDDFKSLAIYDWKEAELIYSEKNIRHANVLGLACKENGDIVSCGDKHVYFWCGKGQYRKKYKGFFGKIGRLQTNLCAIGLPDGRALTGTMSGHIYLWDGRNCKRTVRAHDRCVNVMYASNHGVITGGKDGKVRIWSLPALEPGAVFDTSGLGSFIPRIRSVCWSSDASKILIGTQGNEIYEISSADGSNLHPGPLVQSHAKYQVWGLAVNPMKAEFCTVGDDQTVRIWDMETRFCYKSVKLDTITRCCSYSHDADRIAVGLGGKIPGKPKQKKNGAFVILNESDLTIVHEARDTKEAISQIKFSPDGETLCVASRDNCLYLYNVEDYASQGKCKGHKAPIKNFDFSADGQFIQSTCENGDMMFWNSGNGEQYKAISNLKDVEWHSWTCTYGWPVQGINSIYLDGSEPTACDRNSASTAIAVVNNYGRITLARYPMLNSSAGYRTYKGHSTNVKNVKFSYDDKKLITLGGRDRCIFQWSHNAEIIEDEAENLNYDGDSEDDEDLLDAKPSSKEFERIATGNYKPIFDNEDKWLKDEFKAVKPWRGSVVPPTHPPKDQPQLPDAGLQMEWVHGYCGQGSRSNLFYNSRGDIVYHVDAINIVFTKGGGGMQRFHSAHTDRITCLDMHPEKILFASGALGKEPEIIVWDSETCTSVRRLKGFHKNGIAFLKFSRNGKQIISADMSENHEVALYNWTNTQLLATFQGGKDRITSLDVSPNGTGIVQCGVNHIKFHEIDGGNVSSQRGILGKKGMVQTYFSIGWIGNRPVVGTASGHLYCFDGRDLLQSVKAHDLAVNSIHSHSHGIVSGGKDGKVKVWSTTLELKVEFDISPLGSMSPSVRSVFIDIDKNKILVGTRGSEIFEISGSDGADINGGPLITGHYKYELWGLSCHPHKPEFCTVGDDQTVRIWNIKTRKLIRKTKLDTMARSCCYDMDGQRIAIGLGGRVGKGRQKKDGSYLILNENDLTVGHEARDSKMWISDIKFSPDGNSLAVASQDNKIYLYDVSNGFLAKAVMDRHNSYVTNVDFSEDNQYLQSNCGAFEYICSDASTGSYIPAVSTLKDVRWATWTCPLGWPTLGIWPTIDDGTHVESVDRNSIGDKIATSDSFGRVRLYNYPCTSKTAAFLEYRVHASHATKVRWTAGDSHVISIGGSGRSIVQWKVLSGELDEAMVAGDSGEDSDLGEEQKIVFEEDGADNFLAVKPWVGAIVPPSNPPASNTAAPNVRLELEHVYGYNAQLCRNNLYYAKTGEIVYHAAAIGIVYDKVSHQQKFFRRHKGTVISLAVDSNRRFAATGERCKRPLFKIWDAATGMVVHDGCYFHRKGVALLDFSSDGRKLISVGMDPQHTMAIWSTLRGDWTDMKLLAYQKTSLKKVLFAKFTSAGEFQCVTGGINHVMFWQLHGKRIDVKQGIFGRKGKKQPILSAATVGKKIVTGTVSGHLYVWEGYEIVRSIYAHERSVNSLHACRIGLVSGGKDGIVKTWDLNLNVLKTFNISEAKPSPLNPCVRSVCQDPERGLILVGTKGSEIYEICTETGSFIQVSQGHYEDELWGLTTYPTNDHPEIFVTSGDDKTIRMWDMKKRRLISSVQIDSMTRAIDFSPDGSMLGAGLGGSVGRGRQKKDGAMIVLSTESLSIVHQVRDSRDWITEAKFSPDGTIFAIGSRDNKIYLYDVEKAFALRAKCEKHNNYITHFDFSEDSSYIQSNCGGFELLYATSMDGEHVNSPSTLKDINWNTWTCTLGWPVQEYNDGVEIHSACRSNDSSLLCVTNGNGEIKMYRYPVLSKAAECVQGSGYAEKVTKARFSADDNRLITIGGSDRTVMQWKVIKGREH
eukprot:g2160.t1